MARMLGAIWLGEHSPKRLIEKYDRIILHTIVGTAPVHTPHFSVAGDGTIYQSRDTKYQSAVSLEGNPTSIGIEAEDRGTLFPDWNPRDGHAVPAYTDAQVEAIARICAWAHREHGIPLVACPDSRPGSRGIAYHRQGIDGNFLAAGYQYGGRVAGGERWSEAYGKVCPGDRRIAQIPRIIKRAREIQEEDMPSVDEIRDAVRAELNAHDKKIIGKYVTGVDITATSAGPARYAHLALRTLREQHAEVMELLGRIAQPMSDAQRQQLAADIAARVDRLRVELRHDDPQEETNAE